MDTRRRLQLDVDDDTLHKLDQVAVEVRSKSKDRRVGAGTVAALIIKRVLSRQDLIRLWFYDDNPPTDKARIIGKK